MNKEGKTPPKPRGRPENPEGSGTALWIKAENLKMLSAKYPEEPARIIVNKILKENLQANNESQNNKKSQ